MSGVGCGRGAATATVDDDQQQVGVVDVGDVHHFSVVNSTSKRGSVAGAPTTGLGT